MNKHLRDRLISQRMEDWRGEMRRNPEFRTPEGTHPLLAVLTEVVFDDLRRSAQEAIVLAVLGSDRDEALRLLEREVDAKLREFAEGNDPDQLVHEHLAELDEIERDRRIDHLIDERREAA
jgi:hypothetical protein